MLCHYDSFSQDSLNHRSELFIQADNDAFTLDKDLDHYYSTGIFVGISQRGKTKSILNFEAQTRSLFTFQLRMFTPIYIGMTDPAWMDRPFAATTSLAYKQTLYFSFPFVLSLGAELGWIGPSNRLGNFQEIMHETLGMQKAHGWKFQIADSPILNIYATSARAIKFNDKTDIISESNMAFGNLFTHFRQEFIFRFGRMNSIHNSVHYGRSYTDEKELYAFIGPAVEWVFHNGSIDGNIIGKESLYTEKSTSLVYKVKGGVMYNHSNFNLGITYHWLSKETIWARNHRYVSIIVMLPL